MSAQAHRDLVFRARGHNSLLRIDAGTVLLPGLPALARQPRRRNPTNETVYQLCICRWASCHVSSVATCHYCSISRSGRLFLAPPLTHCIADSHVCREIH